MILAMVLAHLVGDFVLQNDKLAYRKSQDIGVGTAILVGLLMKATVTVGI